MALDPLSSEFSPGLIDRIGKATSDISNSIAYVREYADDMRSVLTETIDNMVDSVGDYDYSPSEVDTNLPQLDSPSFPTRPTFGDLPLDWDFPDDVNPPVLLPYGNLDFEFVTPTPPTDIDGSFNWTQGVYSSEMWEALFSKVHSDIISGGNGLSPEVHGAIISREREARRVSQDRETRRALATIGARGFNLPSGQASALVRAVLVENTAKDQDSINNVLIKDFELAQENARSAIKSGTDLETIIRDSFSKNEALGMEAEKAAKDYILAVYAENVKAYLAKWEGVRLDLEAKVAKVEAITAMNDGLNKTFIALSDSFKTKISAITAKNSGMIDNRMGEISVYKSEVEAVGVQYALVVEELKANVTKMETEAKLVIEEERIKLLAHTTKSELADGINQAIANIGAQAVASALGAINTSMSEGYSASDSISHRGETIYNML